MIFISLCNLQGATLGTDCRDKESILKKRSVWQVNNTDNNCFWYALQKSMNPDIKIRNDRPNRCKKEAEALCSKTHLAWDEQVSLLHIPVVEEAFGCNIYVIDMAAIPILGCHEINLWETLMYRSPNRSSGRYWLLFDNNHYHTITDIKGFLGVKHFCHNCFKMHKSKEAFQKKHVTTMRTVWPIRM